MLTMVKLDLNVNSFLFVFNYYIEAKGRPKGTW